MSTPSVRRKTRSAAERLSHGNSVTAGFSHNADPEIANATARLRYLPQTDVSDPHSLEKRNDLRSCVGPLAESPKVGTFRPLWV
jgi:hypothetical protein